MSRPRLFFFTQAIRLNPLPLPILFRISKFPLSMSFRFLRSRYFPSRVARLDRQQVICRSTVVGTVANYLYPIRHLYTNAMGSFLDLVRCRHCVRKCIRGVSTLNIRTDISTATAVFKFYTKYCCANMTSEISMHFAAQNGR